jgi:hypothetical protein
MMPPQNAHVWVEFAGGDPNRPIWSGCFWADGESAPVSVSPLAEKKKMVKTDTCTLTLDDTPGMGGIAIEMGSNMKITIKAQGIEISNSVWSIKLSATSVSINDGALEVT